MCHSHKCGCNQGDIHLLIILIPTFVAQCESLKFVVKVSTRKTEKISFTLTSSSPPNYPSEILHTSSPLSVIGLTKWVHNLQASFTFFYVIVALKELSDFHLPLKVSLWITLPLKRLCIKLQSLYCIFSGTTLIISPSIKPTSSSILLLFLRACVFRYENFQQSKLLQFFLEVWQSKTYCFGFCKEILVFLIVFRTNNVRIPWCDTKTRVIFETCLMHHPIT